MPALREIPAVLPAQHGRSRSRLAALDTLRGLALVSMIVYHLCYNLHSVFGVSMPWFRSIGAWIWQLFTSGSFLLLAGVCTHLSGRPLRQALRTGIAALGITLATLLFMPSELIIFGILHCMTACQLIYAGTRRSLRRIRPWIGLVLCVVLYAATFHVVRGYLFFGSFSIALPQDWYQWTALSVLGFRPPDFYSADYFPLLPNLFLFLAGHYLGYWMPRLPRRAKSWSVGLFAFLGRHSMLVYLLHQPILFGILQLTLG